MDLESKISPDKHIMKDEYMTTDNDEEDDDMDQNEDELEKLRP